MNTKLFIQPDWPAPPQIRAYSSLRGKQRKPEFNLALHVEADPQTVEANRALLRQQLNLPTEPLWITQVHGNRALEALEIHRDQEADASFSYNQHQICIIMTADCLPILLCDIKGTRVAAIHAGWRGLARGIIPNTLKALNCPSHELFAWLGPAIGPQKFEVGQDVYSAFLELSPLNNIAFHPTSKNKWLANIYELARLQLRTLGLTQIYGGQYCTYTQHNDFFSYRRDGQKAGRMASLIWIEP